MVAMIAALAFYGAADKSQAGTFSSSTTAPVVNVSDLANFAAQTGTDKWFFQTREFTK